MSVVIEKDGTLRCNTVRYNYKQARNLIADNNGDQNSGTSVWSQYQTTYSPLGYKAYSCFKLDSTKGNSVQVLPKLYATHKYYLSARINTTTNPTSAKWSVVARKTGAKDIGGFANETLKSKTDGNWVLYSTMVDTSGVSDSDSFDFCLYYDSSLCTDIVYVSRLIMIDLTDTFGEGNEPSKEWLDNNIIEHETYLNFASFTPAQQYSTNGYDRSPYNYLQLDSNWEPRDYMFMLNSTSDQSTISMTTAGNRYLDPTTQLYFCCEYQRSLGYFSEGDRQDNYFSAYFPADQEPWIGWYGISNNTTTYNGGGGMNEWKKMSIVREKNDDVSDLGVGYYKIKLNINNPLLNTSSTRLTNIHGCYAYGTINAYNTYNNVSISSVYMWAKGARALQRWCNRWVGGRADTIIHIKDPKNTGIRIYKPLKAVNLGATAIMTKAVANGLVGQKEYEWTGVANISDFKVGDYAYVKFTISDTNSTETMLIHILEIDYANNKIMKAENYTYGSTNYNSDIAELVNGYIIQCNDIEIRPEVDKVTFDSKTGTIKCKYLVTSAQI